VTLQAALGIATLLYVAPLPLALAHQVLAILAFSVAVIHVELLLHRELSPIEDPRAAEQGA
jgi:heme A synthase